MHYSLILSRREFPTHPSGGLIPPKLSHNTPGFRRKGGERERGGREKGREEEKGIKGTPKGWLTPPMFQILKNTLPKS